MIEIPINDNAAGPAPIQVNGVGIAAVPVTLEGDQEIFEIKLRDPGIVRACAFWLKRPAVLAPNMRGVEYVQHPLLLVECRAGGDVRERRFAFVTSDRVLAVHAGFEAHYCATAIGQHGAGHLFEIVAVAP